MLARVLDPHADLSSTSTFSVKRSIEGYARVLYDNYRARTSSSMSLPTWNHASPVIKREFKREAKQELGY